MLTGKLWRDMEPGFMPGSFIDAFLFMFNML